MPKGKDRRTLHDLSELDTFLAQGRDEQVSSNNNQTQMGRATPAPGISNPVHVPIATAQSVEALQQMVAALTTRLDTLTMQVEALMNRVRAMESGASMSVPAPAPKPAPVPDRPVFTMALGSQGEGTIAKLVQDKGYGFIRVAGHATDIFFHSRNIVTTSPSWQELTVGRRVRFVVVTGMIGYQAGRVEILPVGVEW